MSFFYLYPPDRYVTTHVNQTFPEHHWPLGGTMQKFGHALQEFGHPYETDVRTPHSDIRETPQRYYIDIELPGVSRVEEVSLKWTSGRTFLVEATSKRPEIPEEQQADSSQPGNEPSQDTTDVKSAKARPQHPVHYLARERRLGLYSRAFHFGVDVEHDKLEARLKSGLLRITLPKPEVEQKQPKQISVQHEDS